MRWTRKSKQDQMYCAVHNVDCPLHGHDGDPWVLDVAPMLHPGAWICPQAVKEIEEFGIGADEKLEENTVEPASIIMDPDDERIIRQAVELEGYDEIVDTIRYNGVEGLSLEMIDGCIYALEEHQRELSDEAERIHTQLIEAWEERTGEEYDEHL